MRPFTGYPPFSGHAVFSIYLLITCTPLSTRISGLFLLAVTLYAKLIIWKGDTSLIPGPLVGLAAGLAYRHVSQKPNSRKESNRAHGKN